jgi:sucrose-phosphate synthase
VITSTQHEIDHQYGLYHHGDVPDYQVIPPGIDIDTFYPFYHDMFDESERSENARYAQASMLKELNRFFMHPDRPLILSLCRPDKRKNITGLIRAYGEDKSLQSMANLAVFAGIRKDITEKEENERDVLTRILLLMDKYDLYGKIAIPKKHDFEYEVPALYRIAADKKGVFVNSALTEPFGITLLEAAATGLPIVAPNDGGPQDIIKNCDCGLLVDTTDTKELAGAIKTLIIDAAKWKAFSKNGIMNVRKYYTWEAHGAAYVDNIRSVLKKFQPNDMTKARPTDAIGRRIAGLNYFLVTDIDNTLIGDDNSHLADLCDLLTNYRDGIGFAVATGRTIDSAVAYLQKFNVPVPDIIISSVGTEIYYGPERHYSRGWDTHISAKWDREKIVALLADFSFLTYQEEATQRKFKISYDMKPGKDRLANIHSRLLENKCSYNLIYSHDKYLDILPYRASKGKAVRYLSYKWDIPLKNFLVCGDSGNDEEMLRGEPMAAVMGNFSLEVAHLKGQRKVFFAKSPCAGGILEAVRHYRLIEKAGG